jgi:hypothetical protein
VIKGSATISTSSFLAEAWTSTGPLALVSFSPSCS